MLEHSNRLGLACGSLLCRPVFHYLLPVGHPTRSLLATSIQSWATWTFSLPLCPHVRRCSG